MFVVKKVFENDNIDLGDNPLQSATNEGHSRYASWQRLTKQEYLTIQIIFEENKIQTNMERFLPKRFLKKLPKTWFRLIKRHIAWGDPQLEEDQFKNIQQESVHNHWFKQGYVTG